MSGPMHVFLRTLMGGALAAALVPATASADFAQIGSSLAANATITETHQQDSMFWARTIAGTAFTVPADGQITKAWVKGTVLRQAGAGPPLNKIAFQVVRPQADGSLKIPENGGSSAPFDLPYEGDPNQITTYDRIENLCVKAGDFVAFNNRGGWQYAGTASDPNAMNPSWYPNGAPFRVFGAVANSSTFRFTKHDGTKNGMTVSPPTELRDGSELLMRLELATGKDASQPCGGPPRHADGQCVYEGCATTKPDPTKSPDFVEVRLVHPDGGLQRAYVPKARTFTIGAYCAAPAPCSGQATLTRTVRVIRKGKAPTIEERPVATAAYRGLAQAGFKIKMTLTKRLHRWVRSGKMKTRTVTMTFVTATGRTYVEKMQLGN